MNLSEFLEALLDAEQEGIAVFMAGGVGVGKSTFAELILGKDSPGFVSIRPDALLERAEAMEGRIRGDKDFQFDAGKRREVVSRSKKSGMKMFTKRSKANYNVILDRTGRAVAETKKEISRLEKLGYKHIYMIFIYTEDVEISKKRNLSRKRNEPEEVVIEYHNYAIKNKPIYAEMFGDNFMAIHSEQPVNKNKHLLLGMTEQIKRAILNGEPIARYETRFNEKLNS